MDKQGILEGLLFVSGSDGITLAKLEEVLELKQEEVLKLIDDLKEVYSSSKHGIDIQYLGNTYKLTTKSEHKDFYKQLVLDENSNLLGQSALETLAIRQGSLIPEFDNNVTKYLLYEDVDYDFAISGLQTILQNGIF